MPFDDAYTKSLLLFDGVDESTDFVDEKGKTWTAHGSAKLDTGVPGAVGSACGSFLDTSPLSYIDTPDHVDFHFDGDFTISCRIRLASLPAFNGDYWEICGHASSDYAESWDLSIIKYSGSRYLLFYLVSATYAYAYEASSDAFVFEVDTWYDVSVIKEGGVIKVAINNAFTGTPLDMGTDPMPVCTETISIGQFWDIGFDGWIDDFEVSKGIARDLVPLAEEEQGDVVFDIVVTGEDNREEAEISVDLDVEGEDNREEQEFVLEAKITGILIVPASPVITSILPGSGQTRVRINSPISFILCSQDSDDVAIDSVQVQIDGTLYQNGDPEFSFSGAPNQYSVEVSHPNFGYEQDVTVTIEAASVSEALSQIGFTFHTELDPSLIRHDSGEIELYESGKYDLTILTVQEDWCRQGVERYTHGLEAWYGRYQEIPRASEVELRVIAGNKVGLGSEVIANGYLGIRIGGTGDYIPIYADTVISLGPMYRHSEKEIDFRLLVPEGATTKRYFVVELQFRYIKSRHVWGGMIWGSGRYSSGPDFTLCRNRIFYRAYVFDRDMWNELVRAGVTSSPFERGADHQW